MSRKAETICLIAVAALYFGARLPHIDRLPIWGYDEGSYLAAARALAHGEISLYSDAYLVQPPGVFLFGAGLFRAFGDNLTAVRVCYVVLGFVTVLCVCAMGKTLCGPGWGWTAAALYAICPAVATHYGQRVYLEPLACVSAYLGLALVVCSRHRAVSLLAAGFLFGLAAAVKYPAATIPLFAVAALLASREPGSRPIAGLLLLFAGLLVALALTLGPYVRLPEFWEQTVIWQRSRPMDLRLNAAQFMPALRAMLLLLPLGLAGAFRLSWQRGQVERLIGWTCLGITVLSIALARELYWRHLILALPLYAVCTVALLDAAGKALSARLAAVDVRRNPSLRGRGAARKGGGVGSRGRSPLLSREAECSAPERGGVGSRGRLVPAIAALAILLSAIPVARYVVHGGRPESQERLLSVLAAQPEPVFTLDPIYVLEAGKSLPRWRFGYDAFPASLNNRLTDAEVRSAIDLCPTVVMNLRTEREVPDRTIDYVARRYRSVYTDASLQVSVYVR